MPSRPPSLKQRPRRKAWDQKGKTRQSRGYGRAHELMRIQVLHEEPLCRLCLAAGQISASAIADHKTPKAEGGGDERANYQGLCLDCNRTKTAAEAKRGRARR